MASPTWFFDGVRRRIYEVPPGATFTTDGNGYRIYDGGPGQATVLTVDVKRDLWSRWIDWHALNDWALLAFAVSGGAQRANGSYQSADFTLLTAVGWRIVLADYPHETVFNGNLQSQGSDSLFDISRLTAQGVMPRLVGSDALITYNTGAGGSGATAAEVWAYGSRTLTSASAPTAEANAAATLAALIEGGLTLQDVLRIVLAVTSGDATGLEGSNMVFKSQDGSKNRVEATYASGTRNVTVVDPS